MFSFTPCYVALAAVANFHFTKAAASFVPLDNDLILGDESSPFSSTDAAFGYKTGLSQSGRTLVVAAPNRPSTTQATSGALFVYQLSLEETDDNGIKPSLSWKLAKALYAEPGEERLGEVFSLNPTGDVLAVRHEDRVQLYSLTFETDLSLSLSPMGDGLAVDDCPGSISDSFLQLTSQFLVLGCERFDQDRGKIDVFVPKSEYNGWEHVVTLKGLSHGDRFGATAVLDESVPTFSKLFRLAVSAPGYDQQKGLLQVWDLDLEFADINEDSLDSAMLPYRTLVGSTNGDRFGESLAMSLGSNTPVLTVGSPGSNNETGRLSIYIFNESSQNWSTAKNFLGKAPGDAFGTALSMTPDASQVVASSASGFVVVFNKHHSQELGFVYGKVADLVGTIEPSSFGHTIALNKAGSLVVVSGPGRVVSFLDESPFCGIPFSESDIEAFLERRICNGDKTELISASICASQKEFINDIPHSCVWYSRAAATSWPSGEPSAMPSETPSQLPTLETSNNPETDSSNAPSSSPSWSTTSPTTAATYNHDHQEHTFEEPSSAPSATPLLQTKQPTTGGSVHPTLEPTTSVQPSLGLPTAPPSTKNEVSNDSSFLEVFRCDASGDPVTDPLLSTSTLQLCLSHPGQLLQISKMSLEQGQSRVILLDENESNNDLLAAQGLEETAVTVDCHQGDCQVEIRKIPSFMFGPERPSEIKVTGWATVNTAVTSLRSGGLLRTRKLVSMTSQVLFSIIIPLELNNEAQMNNLANDSTNGEQEEDEDELSWLFVSLWIALALLMMILCWCHVRSVLSKNRPGIE